MSLIFTGYIYPALLTCLVPIRSYVLTRCFSERDMEHLDPSGESEQEYYDEQKEIEEAQRRRHDSFDSEQELIFPNRAEFRPEGLARELRHRRHAAKVTVPLSVQAKIPEEKESESLVNALDLSSSEHALNRPS